MPGQPPAPASAGRGPTARRAAAPSRPLRWLLGATALLWLAPPASAAKLYAWKDADGVTHYADHPPDPQLAGAVQASVLPYRNPPGALAQLRLESQGARQLAWAENRLYGPVQVELRYRRADNVTAVPALPARAVLPSRGSALISRLYVNDPRYGSHFDLVLDALPGDPAAKPEDYAYRLPFEYGRVRVDQGFGGSFSHNDTQNYYALDFAVPEGTPVLAVRDGWVMQVESDFDKAGLNREKFGGRANFIRIVHDDGTMAVYAHLKWDGVQVRTGQRVRAGQRIALSGNTGYSTAPHLHFVLQVNRGMRLESIPFRMFGTLGELKFARDGAAAAPADTAR